MPQGAKIITTCRELPGYTPTLALYLSHTSRQKLKLNQTQWWLMRIHPKLCPSHLIPVCVQHATWANKPELWLGVALRQKNEFTVCVLLSGYVWNTERERVSTPRGCPPCCLFVLTFLTIKPQGKKKKSLYPFIEVEGGIRKWEKYGYNYYIHLMRLLHLSKSL